MQDLVKCYQVFMIAGLSIFIPLIPLWFNNNIISNHDGVLHDSVNSIEFKFAAVSFITASVPLLLDVFIEILSRNSSKHLLGKSFLSYKVVRNVIAISSFIVGIEFVSFSLNSNGYTANISTSYLYSITYLKIVYSSALLIALTVSKPQIFTPRNSSICTVAISCTAIFRFFTVGLTGYVEITSQAFLLLSVVSTVIYALYGFREVLRAPVATLTAEDCSALLYLSLLVIVVVFPSVLPYLQFDFKNPISTASIQLALSLYVFVFVNFLIMTIPVKLANNHILKLKDNIIETKTAYVRFVSHEMRTPLNTVFMGLKLSMRQIALNKNEEPWLKDQYQTLTEIYSACGVALDILNELLLYDKLDFGLLELKKQEVLIIDLMNDSVDMFAVQTREKNIQLSVEGFQMVPGTLTSKYISRTDIIKVDRSKIQQVLRNIISNALKFTPEKGSIIVSVRFESENDSKKSNFEKRISISATRSFSFFPITRGVLPEPININNEADLETANMNRISGYFAVRITDTGAGMSAENQKRLFKEVVQFSPEVLQSGGGSGLGMWLSKSIVDMHDGIIKVYSAGEGKGSTFTLKIPMTRLPVTSTNTGKTSKPKAPMFSMRMSSAVTQAVEDGRKLSLSNVMNLQIRHSHRASVESNNEVRNLYDKVSQINETTLMRNRSYSKVESNKSIQPLRLLIVDDSKLNRKMLCKVLASIGHQCEEAEDGVEALNKVKRTLGDMKRKGSSGDSQKLTNTTYDAILMDFIMPKMDGPTATSEIRKIGYKGPIFGVTGNALPQDQETFISSGASRVLIKPVDTDVLEKTFSGFFNPYHRPA